MRKILCFIFILNIISVSWGFCSLTPLEAVKGPMEKAIAILQDKQFDTPEKKEIQKEQIWKTVKDIFDFRAVSIRSLGRYWRRLSFDQQKEFIEEFTILLKNTYIRKLQGEFHNEEIVYVGEDVIDKKAVVQTKILRGNIEIPMDYSMFLSNDIWKIYDVKIEGISLVKNYRTQFEKILSKDKPAQLIELLKEKNKRNEDNDVIQN